MSDFTHENFVETKAPNDHSDKSSKKVFLAGSIENGAADDWQSSITEKLKCLDIEVLNPRRDDWDSSWVQDISNENFSRQVNWELDSIINADFVLFYFDPKTKSPITLAELGMSLASGKNMVVCCPDGYWRKGNVQIMCKRSNVDLVQDLDSLEDYFKDWMSSQ